MTRTPKTVDDWYRDRVEWHDVVAALRTILLDTVLEETLKWKHPCYTDGGKNIVIIGHKVVGIFSDMGQGIQAHQVGGFEHGRFGPSHGRAEERVHLCDGHPVCEHQLHGFDDTLDANAVADYANFCRISGTPEELLIDFGLNPQPVGTPTEPIVVTQRIVTSWHTAKRLLGALKMSVDRHENVVGVQETDIQQRVRKR